jgi:Fuc2NAc and GlcNAc transferase
MNNWGIVSAVMLLSLGGSYVYLQHASKHGPYATPNYRSLHLRVTPRGAGLAVAFATLLGYLCLYFTHELTFSQIMVYLLGGVVVAAMGMADDRLDISARYRMPFQFLAAVWTCQWFRGLAPIDLGFAVVDLGLPGHVLLVVALVWFYNLYNFIDGIDGMASSATIFICAAMGTVLIFKQATGLGMILVLLGVASAGFLGFNWPPARMFLGDAGSSFMGYVLAAVFVESLWHAPSLLWAWLIAGGFYFADTTLTTTVRLLTVPGWYRPHRSHAYQNLARVWNSHRRVVLLVLAINLAWVSPMLWIALNHEAWIIGLTAVVYVPIAIFCLKYGPWYANK